MGEYAIKFSHNWNNKLNTKVFTTIRKWNRNKEEYYRSAIGEIFKVDLGGHQLPLVKLVNVDIIEYAHIPVTVLAQDVGYTSREKADQIFARFGIANFDRVIILLFERVK